MEKTEIKKYEKPEMKITDIKAEDIIQTSGGDDGIIRGGLVDFISDWLNG